MTDTINFTDFWLPLFYGNASWIGLAVIIAVLVVIVGIWKYGFLPSFLISIFLGLNYITSVETYNNPDLMWNGIILFAVGIVFLLYGVETNK